MTSAQSQDSLLVALGRSLEFRLPLALLSVFPVGHAGRGDDPTVTNLRLRVSLWQNRLPVDALPEEGWIELHVEAEDQWLSC